jgi:hypothetical protein
MSFTAFMALSYSDMPDCGLDPAEPALMLGDRGRERVDLVLDNEPPRRARRG